jgi:hypothetical protein
MRDRDQEKGREGREGREGEKGASVDDPDGGE